VLFLGRALAGNVRPLTDRRGNRREISLPNADEVMENIGPFYFETAMAVSGGYWKALLIFGA